MILWVCCLIAALCSLYLWMASSCSMVVLSLSVQIVTYSVMLAMSVTHYWIVILSIMGLLGGLIVFLSFILMMLPNPDLGVFNSWNYVGLSMLMLLMMSTCTYLPVVDKNEPELLPISLHLCAYGLCFFLLLFVLLIMVGIMNYGYKSIYL
uniref:NADH dehydrogenase subunit 6 n=1 Tax=Haematopinus apri TaxID=1348091 RepID=R9ZPK7_9NEOP|nr:NADH dehydrogenase subunit 6 [Haematopinus apri]